jgi:hypothetical protein
MILGLSEGDSSLQKDGNMREESVACSSRYMFVSNSGLGPVGEDALAKAAICSQQLGLAPQQRSAYNDRRLLPGDSSSGP